MIQHSAKLIASRLRHVDVVSNVTVTQTVIAVDFTTGIRERFCYDGKPRRGTRYGLQWSVTSDELRFTDPTLPVMPATLGQYGHLRVLPRSMLVNSSIIDQRVLAHRFIQTILNMSDVSVPEIILNRAMQRLRAIDIESVNLFSHYNFSMPKRPPWSPVWLHHFCQPKVADAEIIARHLNNEILKYSRDISTITLLFQMNRRFGSPLGYAHLFKSLGIKSVLDMHPDCGKMLGCVLAGVKYTGVPTPVLDQALSQGITDNCGLDYEPYSDDLEVDLVICDHSLQKHDLSGIKEYTKHSRSSRWKILSWCTEERATKLSKLPTPKCPKLIPIHLSKSKPNSYLALW